MRVPKLLVLTLLAAVSASVVPGSAITPEQIEEALQAAHEWLKSQQYTEKDVGKVIEYRDSKTGQKARYVVKETDVGGMPSSWRGYPTEACLPRPFGGIGLEYIMRAAEAGFPVDKEFVRKIIKHVWNYKGPRGCVRKEDPNGKWAYWVKIIQGKEYPTSEFTGKNVVAFCMAYRLGFISKDEWERVYKPFIDKAVRWLMEGPCLHKEEKGWCWYDTLPGRGPRPVDTTGACLRALLWYGVPPDHEVVVKAIKWFLNNQEENGNFVTNPQDVAGHGYTGTQARAALVTLCEWLEAVKRAGKEEELKDLVERVKRALKKGIEFLISLQDPKTGMWGRGPLTEYPPEPAVTALATYALLKCAELGLIDPNHPAIVKGLEALYRWYEEAKRQGKPYYWYWIGRELPPELRERSQTWATAYALAAFALAKKLGVGAKAQKEVKGGRGVPIAPEALALALTASLLLARRR